MEYYCRLVELGSRASAAEQRAQKLELALLSLPGGAGKINLLQ